MLPSPSTPKSSRHKKSTTHNKFEDSPFSPGVNHGNRIKRNGKGKGKGRVVGDESESDEEENLNRSLFSLPLELIAPTLSFLPPRFLLPLNLVSSTLRSILQSDSIWRESYINRFLSPFDVQTGLVAEELKDLPHLGDEVGRVREVKEVLGVVRSCIGVGKGGQGWMKEALTREAMLERFMYSQSRSIMHNPHIDIIHHLSLFYTPPPSKPRPFSSHTPPSEPGPSTQPHNRSPTTTKVIGAKHRQPHRVDLGERGTAGRAPGVVSVGLNAGAAIRGDPLVGKSMLGHLGPGQLPFLDFVDRTATTSFIAPLNPTCILWGLQSGWIVHSTLLNPLPTPGRLTGPSITCQRSEYYPIHSDSIRCLWMPPEFAEVQVNPVMKDEQVVKAVFASGGDDGVVKIWRVDPGSGMNTSGSSNRRGPTTPNGWARNDVVGELVPIWTSARITKGNEEENIVKAEERAGGSKDPVVQVRFDWRIGVLVAACESGAVWVWYGLNGEMEDVVSTRIKGEAAVPATAKHLDMVVRTVPLDVEDVKEIEELSIEILVQYEGEGTVHRYDTALDKAGTVKQVEHKIFGDSTSPILSLFADLSAPPNLSLPKSLVPADFAIRLVPPGTEKNKGPASGPSEVGVNSPRPPSHEIQATTRGLADARFIVTGDLDGMVSVFKWDDKPVKVVETAGEAGELAERQFVKPVRRWNTGAGAVTCVTAGRGLIASGSFDGLVHIWDPLPPTPTLLRDLRNRHTSVNNEWPAGGHPFPGTPAAKQFSVNNIVLESDMFIASIGNQVMGWRAGNKKVKDGKTGGWKGQSNGKHGNGKSSPAKGYNQTELKDVVKESKKEIAQEQAATRAHFERERATRAEYDEIGLEDQDEALQYALMLSRDDSPPIETREDRELREALETIERLELESAQAQSLADH